MMKKANVITNMLAPIRACLPTRNIAMPFGDNINAMSKSNNPIISTVSEKSCISLIARNRMPPAIIAIKPTMPQIELQNGEDFN